MAVKRVGEKYRCNVCGNEVTVTKAGGGTLVCCEQDMERTDVEQDAWQSTSIPDTDAGGGDGGGNGG